MYSLDHPLARDGVPDAFDVLEMALFDVGARPCRATDCMQFALPGRSQCELCLMSDEQRRTILMTRAVAFGHPFAGSVPLRYEADLPRSFRDRLVAGLEIGASLMQPMGRYGMPVWLRAAESFRLPGVGFEKQVSQRLDQLLGPGASSRAHDSFAGSPAERLAADVIDLVLSAIVLQLPTPRVGEVTNYTVAANTILCGHWQMANPLRCGAWGEFDSLAVAPLVGWAEAITNG